MKLSAFDIDILNTISKRGVAGITKDELMFELGKTVKGIAYGDLKRHVTALVSNGLAEVEETGPDDFTIMITKSGKESIGA